MHTKGDFPVFEQIRSQEGADEEIETEHFHFINSGGFGNNHFH